MKIQDVHCIATPWKMLYRKKGIVPPIKAHYQMGMLRLGTHLTVK
jgi:hypothetical protein